MNVEKGILIAGLVFVVCMAMILGMRTPLTERTYEIEKMFITDGLLVMGEDVLVPYKLELKGDPFSERSDASHTEVTIEMPGYIKIKTEKPPVFWQRKPR